MSDRASLRAIDRAADAFRTRLFKISALSVSGMMIGLSLLLAYLQVGFFRTLLPLTLLIPCGIAYVLAVRGRVAATGYVLVLGVFFAYGALAIRNPDSFAASSGLLALILMIAGFVLHRVSFFILSAMSVLLTVGINAFLAPGVLDSRSETAVLEVMAVLLAAHFAFLFSRNARGLQDALRKRVTKLESAIPLLSDSGVRVTRAAGELHSVASDHRAGAMRQSSAVDETRTALQAMLGSSREISQSSQLVLQNAEASLSNSGQLAEQFSELSSRATTITELLIGLKSIANKSDLLALNAAIESRRAGEHGKSFSLVAAEMQRLTDNIIGSIRTIDTMTSDIRTATGVVQSSIEEAMGLAKATTEAAQEISKATSLQQASTEHVSKAMEDIAEITQAVTVGSMRSMSSTEELKAVADRLPPVLDGLLES